MWRFQIGFWVEASLKFHMNGQPERGLTSEFQEPFFEEEGLNIFSVLASLLVGDQLTPCFFAVYGGIINKVQLIRDSDLGCSLPSNSGK